MDKINLLKTYPIQINKNGFGIKDNQVENELFTVILIKDSQYDKDVVEYLAKLWDCPFDYLLGRLRSEVGHKLLYGEKNIKEACKYYELAAKENKSAESNFSLATIKLNTIPTIEGFDQTVALLKLAAESPNKIKINEEKSIENKLVLESQLMLGNLFYDGHGGKKNIEESIKYYKMAEENASNNYTPAFAKLALNYCRGSEGFEKNREKGLTILRKIIEDGSEDPGILYSYGESLFDDDQKTAIEYIRKAAKKGYPIAKRNLPEFEKKIQVSKIKQITNNDGVTTTDGYQFSKKKNSNPKKIKKNNLC
ncbi:hypothetical protein DICPUDRAFT_158927 [Dictyostelium purpureum]|uniref:Uncharacterized protein n=1 Tax=Dictyostelium purpureum TaxID=5786 RepID=F1A2U7_DICPU|nr:uncharacterized protein DICPUDRAFT_158927 [Dictyostelium purpureum]EGC29487.1 hypothetical protein DICPUDRAFT_158927 [Dictyostelium purpureum]|eukprot:XP_003293996.1 hypothetical protein DICPUDRAFT_158927 [Dictyostelium purpureum]